MKLEIGKTPLRRQLHTGYTPSTCCQVLKIHREQREAPQPSRDLGGNVIPVPSGVVSAIVATELL